MTTDNDYLKRQLQAIIDSSVHAIPSVEDEPVTEMTRWRVMQVLNPDGTRSRHLVGWADHEGRASSAIQQLDVRKLVGITRSGRRYELRGESCRDSDADWVFGRWCHINRVVRFKDVSRAVLRLRSRLGSADAMPVLPVLGGGYGVAPYYYPPPRRGAGQDLIYLDFDGVLHHHDVGWSPLRGPFIRTQGPYGLFEHAELLESLLADFPDVRIVLSTSWVKAFRYTAAAEYLPKGLRRRVIGATFHTAMRREEFDAVPRGVQVWNDVCRRAPARWVALDDDVADWPAHCADNLIAMNEVLGLSEPRALEALRRRLEHWRVTSRLGSVQVPASEQKPGSTTEESP